MRPISKKVILRTVLLAIAALFAGVAFAGYEGYFSYSFCGTLTYEKCVGRNLSAEVRWFGLKTSFHTFNALYSRRASFPKECHNIAHALGVAAYEKYKNGATIKPLPEFSACGYGFYHGFMQELVVDTGDPLNARAFCGILRTEADAGRDVYSPCIHGFGHGAVAGYAPGVFKTAPEYVDVGIRVCDEIAKTKSERTLCAGGVYNALAIDATDPSFGFTFSKDDPYAICRGQNDPEFREGCYRNAHTIVSYLWRNRFLPMARITETLPKEDAEHAMDNLSLYQSRLMITPNNDAMFIAMCNRLKQELRSICLLSFVKGLVLNSKLSSGSERGTNYCLAGSFPAEFRADCFMTLARAVKGIIGSPAATRVCSDAPPELKEMCTAAI